ncbi:MAG TPA: hypothetical protein VH678_04020 [Xanthobacteraceae bacterium]|jgi:hypothetical protein
MQFGQLKRREFIAFVGSTAAAWPIAARAQKAPIPVVGVLDRVADVFHFSAFRNGLSELGYIIGRDVVLDVRSTNQYDQLPHLRQIWSPATRRSSSRSEASHCCPELSGGRSGVSEN